MIKNIWTCFLYFLYLFAMGAIPAGVTPWHDWFFLKSNLGIRFRPIAKGLFLLVRIHFFQILFKHLAGGVLR